MKGLVRALAFVMVLALAALSMGCAGQTEHVLNIGEPVRADRYEISIDSCTQYKNTSDSTEMYELWRESDDEGSERRTTVIPRDCTLCALRGTFTNLGNYDLNLNSAFRGVVNIGGSMEETVWIEALAANDYVAPQETKDIVIGFYTTSANVSKHPSMTFKFGFSPDKASVRTSELPVVYVCSFE